MKRRKSFLYALIAATALFALSCSNGSSDSGSEPVSKNTYVAFSHLSPYMQSTLKETDGKITSSTKTVPEVYIVHGSRLSDLSEEQILLAVKTCLEGQTFIIDTPTYNQVLDFCIKLFNVLNKKEYEYYNDMTDIHPYSILRLICQFFDITEKEGIETWKDKDFEAIAMRKEQVYFVHDIDEIMNETFFGSDDSNTGSVTNSTATEANPTEEADESETKDNLSVAAATTDFTAITNSSILAFAEWINSNDTEESRGQRAAVSTLEDAKKAQSFVHNFTATFTSNSDHYDGRYNGKCENVQLYIDVWTACSIDTDTDYYLVRTSAVCNNQQLNYKNEWDNGKYISPWMDYCEITSKLGNGYASLKANECSPGTTRGTSSFTQGQSFSFSGNVGFNSSGPTGGLTTGFSISESRTQSIPDISVEFNLADDSKSATWKFYGPEVKAYWSGLNSHCDGAKDIQTKTAIFDTYAVYTMPSSKYWEQENVPLYSKAKVQLEMLTGWITGILGQNLHWKCPGYWTWNGFTDYVRKPCNSYCNYIMYFDPPSDTSPERIALYNSILKEYITDWNSSVRYYGFCDTSKAWTYERHDKLAASHFSTAENTIKTNQDVLKSRGFEGTFTFRIKNSTTGKQVDSFTMTF